MHKQNYEVQMWTLDESGMRTYFVRSWFVEDYSALDAAWQVNQYYLGIEEDRYKTVQTGGAVHLQTIHFELMVKL